MHGTTRSIARFSIVCAVWFATSLGMTLAALGPVDVALMNVVDLGAVVRATTVLALGFLAGSFLTWMLWASFPVRRSGLVMADERDQVRTTVLGSTASTLRS